MGLGLDAHRFAAGRKLFLGGVEIPYPMGLHGHSDADVVIHALMDAMLGAAGAGDIGMVFPDSDDFYKGAASLDLLRQVSKVLRESGYRVVNADIVVICEEPRIAPYRDEMRGRMAGVLGCSSEEIFVKGTTSEGMGFTGRSEGIMAQAVVLVDDLQAGE